MRPADAPALDRVRLVADLHRAAGELDPPVGPRWGPRSAAAVAMGRAWRIVAAAIADGEYDVGETGASVVEAPRRPEGRGPALDDSRAR